MTNLPPLRYFQMYFRLHLVSMKCFSPSQSYTEVLEGPGNHSRGAILSYLHPILARNKTWTMPKDHYTISTVLLDVFQIIFVTYEVTKMISLPNLYRGFGCSQACTILFIKDRSLPRALFRNMKYTDIRDIRDVDCQVCDQDFLTPENDCNLQIIMPNKTPDHPFKIKDI